MSLPKDAVALLVFGFTYCFLAFESVPFLRLDRAGGVLVGAVAMVAFGVLGFQEAWRAIDGETLVLLTGMMILNVFLEESGFFSLAAERVLGRTKSPTGLLVVLVFLSGALSALFLNDTVCLMLTVPLLRALQAMGLPPMPYVVALAMSANIGSVMTITGNPQNMLIHVYSGYGYLAFLSRLVPVGLVGLATLALLLAVWFRPLLAPPPARPETSAPTPPIAVDRWLLGLTLTVLAGVLIAFALASNLALVAITGAAILLMFSGRPTHDVLARVDWVLLVFFAGLFVVMAGVGRTGVLTTLAELATPVYGDTLAREMSVFALLTVVASNVVSNVPFVVLARDLVGTLHDPALAWLVLSMAATFAGNLTIPGSVATLIVLRIAGPRGRVSFAQFSAIGIPVTILTTALGVALLLWLGAPAAQTR